QQQARQRRQAVALRARPSFDQASQPLTSFVVHGVELRCRPPRPCCRNRQDKRRRRRCRAGRPLVRMGGKGDSRMTRRLEKLIYLVTGSTPDASFVTGARDTVGGGIEA